MSKRHRRLHDLPAGVRVLSGSPRSFWSLHHPMTVDRAVETLRASTVVSAERGRMVLKGEDGNEKVVELDLDGRARDWRDEVLWSDALPAGDVTLAKAYAAVSIAGEGKAVFMHVQSVDGDVATCRLVQPAGFVEAREKSRTKFEEDEEKWTGEVVGNAAFWEHPVSVRPDTQSEAQIVPGRPATPVPAWKTGDLIGAVDHRCAIENGRTITRLQGPMVVGNFSKEGVGAFLPWGVDETRDSPTPDPTGALSLAYFHGPAGFEAYRENEEIARIALEPNEALVVWYKPVGNEPTDESTACSFMGTSGLTFHRIDSVEDYFWNAGIEEGLWVLKDATGWSARSYEGEYDSGIEGDWQPATEEDLARFGYSQDDASTEIADRMEIDAEPDLAARMMEKAVQAVEASSARTSAPA